MNRCTCGCSKFRATQICIMDLLTYVDGDGYMLDEQPNLSYETADLVEAEDIRGPFICLSCGKEYKELEDIPNKEKGGKAK